MDQDTEPSRRVALLDDNPAVRESVSMLLKSVGLETVAFHSPAVFLASAIEDTGCILLDIRMPEMSGLEVHRRLRERGIETPVIFLTGHGDVSMAVRSMREGAFARKVSITVLMAARPVALRITLKLSQT